ncbi:hypothetical protein LTS18_012732, partial [Coniosporium uncinatum]
MPPRLPLPTQCFRPACSTRRFIHDDVLKGVRLESGKTAQEESGKTAQEESAQQEQANNVQNGENNFARRNGNNASLLRASKLSEEDRGKTGQAVAVRTKEQEQNYGTTVSSREDRSAGSDTT